MTTQTQAILVGIWRSAETAGLQPSANSVIRAARSFKGIHFTDREAKALLAKFSPRRRTDPLGRRPENPSQTPHVTKAPPNSVEASRARGKGIPSFKDRSSGSNEPSEQPSEKVTMISSKQASNIDAGRIATALYGAIANAFERSGQKVPESSSFWRGKNIRAVRELVRLEFTPDTAVAEWQRFCAARGGKPMLWIAYLVDFIAKERAEKAAGTVTDESWKAEMHEYDEAEG